MVTIASSPALSFAQSYDDLSGTSFGSTGSGYSWSDFNPSTPVNYNDYSDNNFDSNTNNSGYSWTDFNPYTPVSYSDLNNTNFYDSSTNYGNVSCVGCDTTSWQNQNPVYTPITTSPVTYTPISTSPITYTPITTTPWYTPSPTYAPVTTVIDYYTTPSTNWYTQPTWTAPVYQTITCNNSAGYYLSGNTCIKQCTNGQTVVFPNNCPTPGPVGPPTPVPTCNTANGYYFSNGQCVKNCPNNVIVTQPNQCPIVTPPVICDNANGYYLSGNTCIKQCTDGQTVVFPNNCPAPAPVCDMVNGYYYNGSVCIKQCPNRTSVMYPSQCPAQPPISCDTANGFYLQNGSCIKSCPNNVIVTQPNACPFIPPVVTCDNNNGYYYNGSVCIKFCQSINGYVTFPNNCPNPTPTPPPVPTCDTMNGFYFSNGQCVKNCPNNVVVTQPNQCPFIPPVVTCDNANGYYYNLTTCVKFCQSINGYVTFPNNCPTPQPIPYPVPVPVPTQTQVCFDGSVISAYAVCPSPYKVCPDGNLVSRNGYCPVIQAPIVIPPPAINSVITSIPTQIANTSARCNGIGLIPNNTPSVAWFEYGTNPTLGLKTAIANIGSANISPFTNLLTNLKPSTEYFCRAVMANERGTVRGEVVSFTTKKTAVYYPVATKTVVTKKTKAVKVVIPVKKEIICSDGSIIEGAGEANGKDGISMLEMGQKALSLSFVKTKGDVSPNSLVSYFVTFKNDSISNLVNTKLTVLLPEEMTLLKASLGSYDPRTRELTLAYPVMTPGQSGSLELEIGVAKDALIGKSVAVQAIVSYTLPPKTASGKALTDEVIAYAVSTIVSTPLSAVPAPVKEEIKKSESSKNSFLPNTVVEWVVLFAILLIIIVLVRSIRESYKGKETHH